MAGVPSSSHPTGAISGVTVTGTAANGQVPVASSSSAGAWGYPPGFELAYNQITVTANITDTAEATATAIITSTSVTYDGSPVMLEFFCPQVITDTNAANDVVTFTLFEGATQITELGLVRTVVVANPLFVSTCLRYRFTPSAAAHTYKLCAFVPSTTGTPRVACGAGGTGTLPPAFLRIVKV